MSRWNVAAEKLMRASLGAILMGGLVSCGAVVVEPPPTVSINNAAKSSVESASWLREIGASHPQWPNRRFICHIRLSPSGDLMAADCVKESSHARHPIDDTYEVCIWRIADPKWSAKDDKVVALQGTRSIWASAPSWSPDGSEVAYVLAKNDSAGVETSATIMVGDSHGTSRHVVTIRGLTGASTPMWGSTGESIYVTGIDFLGEGRFMVGTNRAGQEILRRHLSWTRNAFIGASIAPDGRWIACANSDGIAVYDLNDNHFSEWIALKEPNEFPPKAPIPYDFWTDPQWTADSSRVACICRGKLYVATPTTRALVNCETAGDALAAAWVPKSTQLFVVNCVHEDSKLHDLLNLLTGRLEAPRGVVRYYGSLRDQDGVLVNDGNLFQSLPDLSQNKDTVDYSGAEPWGVVSWVLNVLTQLVR